MKHHQVNQIKDLLPVCPGFQGKSERFCSAIMVLLAYLDGEYQFIFQKRASMVRQGGEISFPGGEIDTQDQDSVETAIRETFEELGIPKEKITVLGKLDTYVAPVGFIIEACLGIADINSLEELKLQPEEVEYVFSVPVAYFMEAEPEIYKAAVYAHPTYIDRDGREVVIFPARELGLPERYTKPWGGAMHNFYVYKFKNETIWGLTARFVRDVVNKLKQLPNSD